MRDSIIGMLDFPRSLARDNLDIDNCDHAGNYAERDSTCQVCEARLECSWLYRNDEFSALSKKPLEQLEEAFDFAVAYVDAWSVRIKHKSRTCPCHGCLWLREARKLQKRVVKSL
jgi:hypothetical protein